MNEINLYYLKKSNEPTQLEINKNFEINKTSSFKTNYASSKLSTSKVHQFGFFPEPKNATEAFDSKSYDYFQIPDNIDDFNNSSNWKNNSTSKMSSIEGILRSKVPELNLSDGLISNIRKKKLKNNWSKPNLKQIKGLLVVIIVKYVVTYPQHFVMI
ncbi:hypothetical protein RhiirA1_446716 [Rhizophagus irregularis]|uniref:Uncharacterized protein n=1 Tax=Rhizophagus irregularis TaxID=588596 RepID=A0A2N0QXT4_9GLOM|nr:hypothetical protein RhiirA1_446716 [Rhizophagus irregularis]